MASRSTNKRVSVKDSIIVKQDPENPVKHEILAEAIVRISGAMDSLRRSGLNERAIIALVHDKTHITKIDIHTVLDALSDLREDYCA